MIAKSIEDNIIYLNPIPHVTSRQAVFPGICKISDLELLAISTIGQAFESADARAFVSRPGKSLQLQGRILAPFGCVEDNIYKVKLVHLTLN